MRCNVFKGPNGLRAGWRLLIYAGVFLSLGYMANKIVDAVSHGRQYDNGSPMVHIVYTSVELPILLLATWIMAKIEGRGIADYGLPWRRTLNSQFWQAGAISFVSLTLLIVVLRAAGAYSIGSPQLQGTEILKNGFLWGVADILAAIVEEFFWRGYQQFTLTNGIGFWPAALTTSVLMSMGNTLNPGWTVARLFAVVGFGLIACFLLRRTGDLWMPIGLRAGLNWSEGYFYGVPGSGMIGKAHLFHGSFHPPAWLATMPFGVERELPHVALLLIWWFIFAKWLREVKYPK